MERILPPDGFNTLIQLSLSQKLPPKERNKLLGSKRDIPVSDTNPPRGFFITSDNLQEYLQQFNLKHETTYTIEDVIVGMGILTGIVVFGAHYDPRDVEYVLATDRRNQNGLAIYILDFGMVSKFTPLHEEEIPEDDEIITEIVGDNPAQVARDIWTISIWNDIYLPSSFEGRVLFLYGFFLVQRCISDQDPSLTSELRKRIFNDLYNQIVEITLRDLGVTIPEDKLKIFRTKDYVLDTTMLNLEGFFDEIIETPNMNEVIRVIDEEYPNMIDVTKIEIARKFIGTSEYENKSDAIQKAIINTK